MAGHDFEVQSEEARLVDLQELVALCGGLGESYRRSLQFILQDASPGLTFAEVVKAIRERQQHNIHRRTIRALLYNGGFVQKDRSWFPASDSKAAARQLRKAWWKRSCRKKGEKQSKKDCKRIICIEASKLFTRGLQKLLMSYEKSKKIHK